MTSKILATSLFALLVAGCSTDRSASTSTPNAAAPVGGARVATATATRVRGDLVPTRLVAVKFDPPTEMALLHGSDALAPQKPFTHIQAPEPVVTRDMRRVMAGSDPANYVFALDAPAGAKVVLHPVDPALSLNSVHLVSVATGAQLDAARDISPTSINSRHTPLVADPAADVPQDGKLLPGLAGPLPSIPRDPGFEAPTRDLRVLTFDRPTTPGLVRVVVPADIQAKGVWVEVQQPNTHITLSGVVDELNHGFGDTAEITATLAKDDVPIAGATVDGYIELPDHSNGGALTFTDAGNGKYVAQVPVASADWKFVGVWGVHLHASGGVGPVQFERHTETAFGYYPAHAQIASLATPVVTRGSDGLIDEISFDADIETLATDRFSLKGTLTYTAPDGSEHPLASAQTGQVINEGTGTITLHFDAASLALANVDGPFHLRDVALVSQAAGITQHRIGGGLELVTPALRATEIRFPSVISLQAQDLIDHGDLKLPAR